MPKRSSHPDRKEAPDFAAAAASSTETQSESRWYDNGLPFGCTKCGACCTGGTGYVWVTVPEARRMAEALGMELNDFGRRFLRQINGRYSLVEDQATGACVFLRNNQCSIHTLRPTQCRTFPFWPSILQSEETWKAAARDCEGICDEADLVEVAEIERNAYGTRDRE